MAFQLDASVPTFHKGQRLSFEGSLCTVRYIGPVDGTKNDWVGVEWDDPTRGKHDGSLNGRSYYKCRSRAETAGSFVRPSRRTDKSQSFVSAVHQKYATEITGRVNVLDLRKEIEISGKVVEEVGFDKIRKQLSQLHELKIVLVDGLRVDRAEDGIDKIENICPKIVELDLSRNLFEDCRELVMICDELKNLKHLRLNGNRLNVDPGHLLGPLNKNVLSKVLELGLDDMLLPWPEVWTFIEAFPSLKSLSASGNELLSIDWEPLHASTLGLSLGSLTLEYNSFSSLTDLRGILKLSSLEKLYLKGNRIKTIGPSNLADVLVFGTQLQFVDLSYNDVGDWNFVDRLPDIFPGLTSLRFSHNPVYENVVKESSTAISSDETFMLTLARLGNLKTLNFSSITAAERTNAEMFYLSRIGKAMATVTEDKETLITSPHRRYNELCKLYGPPTVVRASKGIHPDWLDARLIKFTFYMATENLASQRKIQEIPKGFDVYQVKGIVGSLFGFPPLDLRLIWETGQWDPVAGYEDEEEEDSSDEERNGINAAVIPEMSRTKGKWMKREVELEESTRQIGFSIDDKEATVRVELRPTFRLIAE